MELELMNHFDKYIAALMCIVGGAILVSVYDSVGLGITSIWLGLAMLLYPWEDNDG